MDYRYRRNNMNYMRRDALRRTREMQRQYIQANDVQAQPKERTEIPYRKKDCSKTNFSEKKQNSMQNNIFSVLFSNGKLDNDKILIAALIIILAKEGADIKLLLALGYILM